ncbi:uncharacterized protein LOC121251408 [Juglans microcarpa x Juglans regia]|uniref:uncharacterized protein LOC121251408 n=1 Tax=Juglans microcarpa x Juglans regia TaxID=2249226 RepID=UPI001B7EF151|nr:uncharacterized protein LOC121251408 [Juglans microcarpa x Juglans regia]
MGGCATKPKVLKEAQAPGPEKEEKAGAADVLAKTEKDQPPHVFVFSVTEADNTDKKKELDGHDKIREIVDDDRVDEQERKRRSLSHLFKETPVPDFAAQKPETPPELTAASDVVDASENAKTKELTTETAPAADTKIDGKHHADIVDDAPRKVETEEVVEPTPAVETKTLDVPSAHAKAETQRPIETAVGTEAYKDDTSEEKKANV